MKKILTGIAAIFTAVILCMSAVYAEENTYLTKKQAADILVKACDDYSDASSLTLLSDGEEDELITRGEALVMLSHAFGKLPEPKGANLRLSYPAASFTDVPQWAQSEISDILNSGIIAGTSATTLSPDDYITSQQLNLFIKRVYAYLGTNLKDDFYAAVNKETLDSSVILDGYPQTSNFYDLSIKANEDVADIIKEIAAGETKSEDEKKISALYNNILNTESRNKEGITPIKKYLDMIGNSSNLNELMATLEQLYKDTDVSLLLGFGLVIDKDDSTKYDISLSCLSPSLGQSGYASATQAQKEAYLNYIKSLFMLIGFDEDEAIEKSNAIWKAESEIAAVSLTNQECADVDKIYNFYTMSQIKEMFPNIDMEKVFEQTGLEKTDKINIVDVNATKKTATFYSEENIELLKTFAEYSLAGSFGVCLNEEFNDITIKFQKEYLGISGERPLEEIAAQYVQSLLSDYLGEAYVDRHFSKEAKVDVENMVKDIIEVYKSRINKLDWMSDSTKKNAIKKLDNMKLRIGYCDVKVTDLDDAKILPISEGGSFFDNYIEINKTYKKLSIQKQKDGVNKTRWAMSPYTVNACYNPTDNSIEFPAGILQAPFYDVNDKYEKNLGGIGSVIAHEITHAFDNNGAKYDENGNATDWWTQEDYSRFTELCTKVEKLYDNREIAPGIVSDGNLTVSENIADLGSIACITEIESKRETPDYKTLYTSVGKIWCSSSTREMTIYLAQNDLHSPDKLRGSLTMRNFKEFYDAFSITPDDGMWLSEDERITIW